MVELLKISFNSIARNKMRSILTMLGIVIGISSVILMMFIGKGAQSLILSQIVSIGSNTIFVEPGSAEFSSSSMLEEFEVKTLTIEDADAIKQDPAIDLSAPAVLGVTRVVYKNQDEKITFMGITPDYLEIYNTDVISGRLIAEQDIKSNSRVALLGYKIKQDLFGDEDAIGKFIKLKKTKFRVIGVMEEQGTQMFQNLDEQIYLPLTTAQKLLLGADHVRWIVARAKSEKVLDEAVENIRFIIGARHAEDDFKVMSQVEAANMMDNVISIFSLFLSAIASIALIVGGIGIMNIMLVSVTERTREIGLRKAVGARSKNILEQFLLESITLTVLGGIIGIILGGILSFLASLILSKVLNMDWVFIIPWPAVILAFIVSTAVGLVFGLYPARKASRLNPIDALRYE